MDILIIAAFVAPLVALLERNHRRTSSLATKPGATDDRDIERVRADVRSSATPVARLVARSRQSAPAVCRPAVP